VILTRPYLVILATLLGLSLASSRSLADQPPARIRVLIVDGMITHDWQRNTRILKQILERSQRFPVDVSMSPPATQPTSAWDNWRQKFSEFTCVVMNFNGGYKPETGVHWPRELEKSFEDYLTRGGGVVIYHAAITHSPTGPRTTR
jgi:hypothetical protein